jgi:hypothetical protein
MGVYAGTKIPSNNNLIFSIDGRNAKSFPENGKIKSLITEEEKNTTATQQDGYIYNEYGYIDKFNNVIFSNASALTINLLIDNTSLKSGTAFSIYSDVSSLDKPTGISSYSTDVVTTVSTATTSHSLSFSASGIGSYNSGIVTTVSTATTSHSLSFSASGIGSYNSGIVTTVSTATTSHSLSFSASGIGSYNSGIVTTVATATTSHSLSFSASGIGSYSTGVVTTFSEGLYAASYNPEFELSFYLEPNSIKLKNKSSNHLSYLNVPVNPQEKNIYSVIYRTFSTNSTPISLYQNGVLVANSEQQSGSSQFENVGISVFNMGNGYYSQYGIRFINAYNKELNQQEFQLINNLKIN